MRAYDLALMLALFGAVMGVLDECAIWDGGNINTGQKIVTNVSFNQLADIGEPTSSGVLEEIASFGWASLLLLISVLGRIIYIGDIIMSVFGNTQEAKAIATIIQTGIWLTYGITIVQLKTGKSLKGME